MIVRNFVSVKIVKGTGEGRYSIPCVSPGGRENRFPASPEVHLIGAVLAAVVRTLQARSKGLPIEV